MFEEREVLRSVTVDRVHNIVTVDTVAQVLKDGNVIAEAPHRKVYGREILDELLVEVADGSKYVALMGWVADADGEAP